MLQHVTFEIGSGDVEATVGMWALLGFERMEPPPLLRDRFVWVARGTSQIHLQPHEHPTVTDQGHAAVVVDDYEGTLAALRAAGFDPRPGLDAWDAPRASLRDPAGNLVEVMSAAPQPPWPAT
jgi:catechol 2,3-dioxygenase-like lactoylglutathione lyase family enzyme